MTRNYLLAIRRAALAAVVVVCALLAAGSARAQIQALVSVSPEYQLVHLGDEFAVQVRIDDVQALYGFDVLLSFPPDLLEALSAVDEGFLTPGLGSPIIDNDAGTAWFEHRKRTINYQPGTLLKNAIPVRIFTPWEDERPGFLKWIWWLTA